MWQKISCSAVVGNYPASFFIQVNLMLKNFAFGLWIFFCFRVKKSKIKKHGGFKKKAKIKKYFIIDFINFWCSYLPHLSSDFKNNNIFNIKYDDGLYFGILFTIFNGVFQKLALHTNCQILPFSLSHFFKIHKNNNKIIKYK